MPFPRFPDGPQPTGATWFDGGTLITVVFDQPISDGVLNAGNWSFQPGSLQSIVGAQAVGGNLRLTLDGPPIAVSSISYSPPPFDVTASATGTPAAPFSGFPVTTA